MSGVARSALPILELERRSVSYDDVLRARQGNGETPWVYDAGLVGKTKSRLARFARPTKSGSLLTESRSLSSWALLIDNERDSSLREVLASWMLLSDAVRVGMLGFPKQKLRYLVEFQAVLCSSLELAKENECESVWVSSSARCLPRNEGSLSTGSWSRLRDCSVRKLLTLRKLEDLDEVTELVLNLRGNFVAAG